MNKRKFIKLSIFGSLLYSIFPYKISLAEAKKIINQNLTEAQKKIMFEEATERPFSQALLIMRKEKVFITVQIVELNYLSLARNLIVELVGHHLQRRFLELLKQRLIIALA